jgi:hypothetical protein
MEMVAMVAMTNLYFGTTIKAINSAYFDIVFASDLFVRGSGFVMSYQVSIDIFALLPLHSYLFTITFAIFILHS